MRYIKYEKILKVVKVILIALPVAILIMFFLPGIVSYIGIDELKGKTYRLIDVLPEGVIANTSIVSLLVTFFTLLAGVGFQYANSLGAIRLYMIFSVVNIFFTAAPLAVDEYLCKYPYAWLSILMVVGFVISLIVMLKEQDLYYDRLLENE